MSSIAPATKHCPICERDLPTTAFFFSRARPDGLESCCAECGRSKYLIDAQNRELPYQKRSRFDNADPGKKWCSKCEQDLPLVDFAADKNSPTGRSGYCRSCNRAYQKTRFEARKAGRPWHAKHIHRTYGLTVEEYERLLASQGGVCAICGGPQTGKNWHVDHDHATGKVRGILCSGCNTGLGAMRDDPAILRAAGDYLERAREFVPR